MIFSPEQIHLNTNFVNQYVTSHNLDKIPCSVWMLSKNRSKKNLKKTKYTKFFDKFVTINTSFQVKSISLISF